MYEARYERLEFLSRLDAVFQRHSPNGSEKSPHLGWSERSNRRSGENGESAVFLPISGFGGDDGKTLYLTAQGNLYRMPLKIPGIRPNGDNQKLAAQR